MKKMILFILLWQSYIAASDGELRRLLLTPNSSIASMSINAQATGAEVPLVDLGLPSESTQNSKDPLVDLPTSSLIAEKTDLETQRLSVRLELTGPSSRKKDCQKLAAALVVPTTCCIVCAITGGVTAGAWPSGYYWCCGGGMLGLMLATPCIPVEAHFYNKWERQRIEDETQRLDDRIKSIENVLEMREDA